MMFRNGQSGTSSQENRHSGLNTAMKVLFVSHSNITIGGATSSLIHLIRHLPRHHCQIEIACLNENVAEYLGRRAGVSVSLWPNQQTHLGKVLIGWTPLTSLKSVYLFCMSFAQLPLSVILQMKHLRKASPNIVHLNSGTLFSTAIAARIIGLPVVWHVREGGYRGFLRLLSGRLMRRLASSIVCISPAEKHSLFLDDCESAQVVYNPVDFANLDPSKYDFEEERRKLGFRPDDFVVLTLGGANPRKGAAQILEALDHLPDRVKLLVAGPPLPEYSSRSKLSLIHNLENVLVHLRLKSNYSFEYRDRLSALLSLHPIDRIRSIGNAEDVAPLLAACDVLVFAGMTPHFARPIYEAWAMKKPVAAFQMPGMDQNISHGEDGLLVEDLSGEGLAQALSLLLEDSDLCRKMGEAGYLKAHARMQPFVGAKKVFRIYKNALKSNR